MIPTRQESWWLLAIFILISTNAFCDSYRCGRKLIRSGDSAAQVLRICGEPMRKDRGKERILIDGGPEKVNVERWYYQQGRRSFEHAVLLYRGQVVGVDVGDR